MRGLLRIVCSSVLFLFCMVGGAHAALIEFQLTGVVDEGSYGGLGAGDTVSASGAFDGSGLDGSGAGTVSLSTLSLTAGAFSFDETMDSGSGAGLTLSTGGAFSSLDFSATGGVNGSPADFISSLNLFSDDEDFEGSWDASSYNATTMIDQPIPGAVWLFGSGLIALIGFSRRSRKQT